MQSKSQNHARDKLIEEYRSFVHSVARKLVRYMNLPLKLEDEFIAAGYLGLVEAADRYDSESGKDFRSYAFLRIRGAMIDSLRHSSDLSATAYRHSKALMAANDLREEIHHLSSQNGTHANRAEEKKRKLSEVLELATKGALIFKLSLTEAADEVSKVNDESQNLEAAIENRAIVKKIANLVETLPEKERTVITEYYFNNKSFIEIAKLYEGMSKSWVSRLHARALEQLKKAYLRQNIKESAKKNNNSRDSFISECL